MKRIIVALSALAVSAGIAGAQVIRADSAAAVGAVEQFHAALTAGDSARAVAMLAEDVIILESGAIQTRNEYLGGHLGSDMKASQGSKGERTILKVTMLGDVAYIVAKTVNPPTGAPNNTGSESAELMIVARTANGWKIKAVHWSSRRRRP